MGQALPLLVKRCLSRVVTDDGQCLAEAGAGPRLGGADATTTPGGEMSAELEGAVEDAATDEIDAELGIEVGVEDRTAVELHPGRERPVLEPGALISHRPSRDS